MGRCFSKPLVSIALVRTNGDCFCLDEPSSSNTTSGRLRACDGIWDSTNASNPEFGNGAGAGGAGAGGGAL